MFSIISILALGYFPVNFNDVTIKSSPNSESESAFCLPVTQLRKNKVTQIRMKTYQASFCAV